MQVVDRLPGVATDVGDQPVAGFGNTLGASQRTGHDEEPPTETEDASEGAAAAAKA